MIGANLTSPSCSCLGRAAPRTPTRRIPALDLISRPAVAVDCPIEDRNRSLAPGNGNNGRTCPVLGPAQIPPGPPEQDRPPDCTAAGPPGPRGAPCWRDRSGLAALWLPVLALRSLLNGFISALSIRHGAGRSRPCLAQILLVPLESIVVSAIPATIPRITNIGHTYTTFHLAFFLPDGADRSRAPGDSFVNSGFPIVGSQRPVGLRLRPPVGPTFDDSPFFGQFPPVFGLEAKMPLFCRFCLGSPKVPLSMYSHPAPQLSI